MLTPEQAKEALDSFRVEDSDEKQIEAIKTLPKKLRKIAFGSIGRDIEGAKFTSKQRAESQAAREFAANSFDTLSAKDRTAIFSAYFPKMGEAVELTWQFMKGMPYQRGYMRRPFRAPHNPTLTLSLRIRWLQQAINNTRNYHEDVVWFAKYAAYVSRGYAGHTLSFLFAAVIDAGDTVGDEVFNILVDSARGTHEIGMMGRHIPRALLLASRAEGWQYVENMLIAAQREEGLRQTILEAVDESHPEAFIRMLRLILDDNLARFSATVRALNVWVGINLDSMSTTAVNQILECIYLMLTDEDARQAMIESGGHSDLFYALWATAYEDAEHAIPIAADLLNDPNEERRYGAARIMVDLQLLPAKVVLLTALRDESLAVVAMATRAFANVYHEQLQKSSLFEEIEAILARVSTNEMVLKPPYLNDTEIVLNRETVAGILVKALGDRSPKRLIPYMSTFSSNDRSRAAAKLGAMKKWDAEVRDVLLGLLKDRSSWLRSNAFKILESYQVNEDEAHFLEGLLTRKSTDSRRGILSMLIRQKDKAAIASAKRLMDTRHQLKRQGGLEILRLLYDNDRSVKQSRTLATAYLAEHPDMPEAQRALIEVVIEGVQEVPTLDNSLGLMNPSERTQPIKPQVHDFELLTPAATQILEALSNLIEQHKNAPITVRSWRGEEEALLGDVNYGFPSPDEKFALDEDLARLPLREVWTTFWQTRPDDMRDVDGFELLRAKLDISGRGYYSHIPKQEKRKELSYGKTVSTILNWLLRLDPPPKTADFLLDIGETGFTLISQQLIDVEVQEERYYYHNDWRTKGTYQFARAISLACKHRDYTGQWQDEHHARLFQLMRWLDEPSDKLPRHRPDLKIVLNAYRAGAATDADLYDQLLGPTGVKDGRAYHRNFNDIAILTRRKPHPFLKIYPFLEPFVEACRQRILEVELKRGDMPTAASRAAWNLGSIPGVELFIRLATAFGNATLARGYYYNDESKNAVFSKLIRATYPSEADTPQDVAPKLKAAKFPEKRLVELAMYAPQWASHVEVALGWKGFVQAVQWLHAHTKDTRWRVHDNTRERWFAEISESTPLSSQDLLDGAVDVDWFKGVHDTLGPKRWKVLYGAAKYSSGGGGHTRAKLFADAILGLIKKTDVVKRIQDKRHQDSVRALGLLPLDTIDRDSDVLERYKIIQELIRTSRKFGSQRQNSEKLAARIGLENLARTAGYPDPMRLQWEMEALEVADLRDGPRVVTLDPVSVSLSIDDFGSPQLTIEKNGKRLKNIPAKLKKNPDIAELRDRHRDIRKQASRMRQSLEAAMCRGDEFEGGELRKLLTHPVLAPQLEQLIFIGKNRIGYLVDGGKAIEFHDHSRQKLTPKTKLRIAHPHDLYQTGEWHLWQRECFIVERIQPFKQVFRELYLLTNAEIDAQTHSRRYEGHQIQPRKMVAILGSRGWVAHPEEGIKRTFHREGISAHLNFLYGYFTPVEVEGLTMESVVFTKASEWKPLKLEDIPPIMFSEVMRDVDLVVSVAHRGGVDPESTASTVEMRAALLRETCCLLKIENVDIQDRHVLIDGQRGDYSVHLGSGVVHRRPGGAVCIIPVHAQHRGRIFLPFADDDPKTAEVISKALLLARDTEIKDPSILEQLYAMR